MHYLSKNPLKHAYSCNTQASDFIKLGRKVIFSDETQSYYTSCSSCTIIRETVSATKEDDIIHLGFKDDSTMADLGNDFIEVKNSGIRVYADALPISEHGGKDILMVRCDDNVLLQGQANSDQYFINIDQKFKEQPNRKGIFITELPSIIDTNKIHLCEFEFDKRIIDIVSQLSSAGIDLMRFKEKDDLILRLNYKDTSYLPTIIQLKDFCLYENSDQSLFEALVDKNGAEIPMNAISCSGLDIL